MAEPRFDRNRLDQILREVDVRSRAVIAGLDDALAEPERTPVAVKGPTLDEVSLEVARYRKAIAVVQARIEVIENEPSRRMGSLRLAGLAGEGTDLEELRARATSLAGTLAELERLHDALARGAS